MLVIACHFQNNLVLMLQFFVLLLFFAWHTGIPGLLTQVLDAELWKLDSGHWTLDAGLRTLDSELWTLDSGCWTLDAGRWTLDSELWTLDSGRWTLGFRRCTLDAIHFGRWALATGRLSLTVLEQNQKPVSDSAWLNYWKLFGFESLRTSWSRLFCRDYRFWRGYF